MGKEPGEIRAEIEHTRDQMSVTADALIYKADVRSRAKQKAIAKKDLLIGKVRGAVPTSRDQAREKATATKNRLVGRVGSVRAAMPKNRDQARDQLAGRAKRAGAAAKGTPGRLTVGAVTVGALLWRAKANWTRSASTSARTSPGRHPKPGSGNRAQHRPKSLARRRPG